MWDLIVSFSNKDLLLVGYIGPAKSMYSNFDVIFSNSHNQKVQMHMLDLMSSIIMEGDGVTQELLDSILINLIPAHKVCKVKNNNNPLPTRASVA